MADRLSALDTSFLYLEEPTTPMHVGGLAVFAVSEQGFDSSQLVELIQARLGLVPRYRQIVRTVPGHLANPVWVDDPDFDIDFHVRRSGLPKPGSDQQLLELVGRLMSRPLDRHRPLWELYIVDGLSDDRFAVISKTHHAMVDGIGALDIGQVILDVTPSPRESAEDLWTPTPQPSPVELIGDAVAEYLQRPSSVIDSVRGGIADFKRTANRVIDTAGGLAAAARMAARQAPSSPLNGVIGAQRRFGIARTSLENYKHVRKAHGGTVNDVVLATVAGALREWLLFRGEPVVASTSVRAMVPVSVRSGSWAGAPGNEVSSYFVDLPVGEASPKLRLSRVSYAMRGHKDAGQSIGATALVALSGFAPPTLHALGARVASSLSRRLFNVVVTNVPGPQFPLYAAGARMLEVFPVVPLAKGQGVSIGLTSYNGGVYFGLNADRDSMSDVDVLADLIEGSLAELVGTIP
ncbi:MAG: wax ester/triacylglycerol synthase family O-acyltransferase [Geodermatophilaceae bacterium]|nr:wax ester/triacylglycerol synthase family O-acyltransferase [Geodermatophilaceae bacterium]